MTKVLYAVSPIGLGHASRAAAIGPRLAERGFEVEFASGGAATGFLEAYGFKVHDIVREPIPEESNGVMTRPGLWYLRYWGGYRSTRKRMREAIGAIRPQLIVGDEEFSSVSLAIEKGIKHALIADELELGFARGTFSRYVEARVAKWYSALLHAVSSIIVPDFGTDTGNLRFVTPVVREVGRTKDQVIESLGLGPRSGLILFSASGSGIGRFLLKPVIRALRELALPDTMLAVSGMKGDSGGTIRYLGLQRDNQDLVAAADLVISTAGKSTIDEALSYGSPIVAIPIKNHVEQERNAMALGFSHGDIARLGTLIKERLNSRTPPLRYKGAEKAADIISSL